MKKASVCAIICDGHILLLKRHKDDPMQGYSFPGGGNEEGESVLETVCRETLEETSIKLTDPIYIKDFISKSGRWYVSLFYEILTHRPTVIVSDEHEFYVWVKIEDAYEMDLCGNTSDFLKEIQSSIEK